MIDYEKTIEFFIEKFKKTFRNFAHKAPVLLEYKVGDNGIVIKEKYSGKIIDYKFNYDIDVKNNIKAIKDELLKIYPKIVKVEKKSIDRTTDEINELIEKTNISFDEAVLMKKEIVNKTVYRIERMIIPRKDQIIIRDMNTDKVYLYQMKMPVTIFLKKLREKWSEEYGYTVFEKSSYLIKELSQSEK